MDRQIVKTLIRLIFLKILNIGTYRSEQTVKTIDSDFGSSQINLRIQFAP